MATSACPVYVCGESDPADLARGSELCQWYRDWRWASRAVVDAPRVLLVSHHGHHRPRAAQRMLVGILRCVRRRVLLDVDGTLIDSMRGLRRVWDAWADRHGVDRDRTWECATRTIPLDTFAEVAPGRDPASCLAVLHALEDEDARSGVCRAFAGAWELLRMLPEGSWAAVTGNYAHRVTVRFQRLGLPLPTVVIDAESVRRGKPDPEGYLAAARRLGAKPSDCLVVEDSSAGVQAALNAQMTVWTVNTTTRDASAHRNYTTLEAAVPDIVNWLNTERQ